MPRKYQQSIVYRRNPPSESSVMEGQIVFANDSDGNLKMYTKQGGQLWINSFHNSRIGEKINTLKVSGRAIFEKDIKANILYNKKNVFYINSAEDLTLKVSDSGSVIFWDSGDASTITLPDSGDSRTVGCHYKFILNDNSAGVNRKIVCTDTSNEKIVGYIPQVDSDSSFAITWRRGLDSDNYSAITFNGSTQGMTGSYISLMAVTSDKWAITDALSISTGSIATMFSTS